MSIPNRIYRIAKSYLNQARDRIETLDAELAEKELHSSPGAPTGGAPGAASPVRDDTSAEAMMRRAEERIRAARAEAQAAPGSRYTGDATAAAPTQTAATDLNSADFRVLGAPIGSDWSTVQSAYEKLSRRCDPRRFPEGSEEQKDAQRILERVNVAYEALRKRLDPTESRFGKLEF